MSKLKVIRVGTFAVPGSKQIACYTTWYNPAWEGCVEFDVEAVNGNEAKKKAVVLRRAHDAAKQVRA